MKIKIEGEWGIWEARKEINIIVTAFVCKEKTLKAGIEYYAKRLFYPQHEDDLIEGLTALSYKLDSWIDR